MWLGGCGENCGRSLWVRGWQKEEMKAIQHLRSDLCVPGGGHENGERKWGVGECREKYVGRILFSVRWHKSVIVSKWYAMRTRFMARCVAGGVVCIAKSMRKMECSDVIGGTIEGPSMLRLWMSRKFQRDFAQVSVARWECVLKGAL